MIHVFVAYPSLAPESDAALAEAATFLAAHPPSAPDPTRAGHLQRVMARAGRAR